MKFYTSLYVLISMLYRIEAPRNKELLYPAITMVYYPDIDLYTFTDLRTVQSTSSLPDYSHVLLLCPDIPYHSQVQVLITNSDQIFHKDDPIDTLIICELQYKAGYSATNNDIGYYIEIADEILSAFGLPLLNKMKQKHEYYAFYKIMDIEIESLWKRTKQTKHTLVSYKLSFGTGKLCDEYSCNDVAGLDHSNMLQYYDMKSQKKKLNKFAVPTDTYFIPHRLVPTEDFVDDGSRQASCSDWNITPIWMPISKGPIKLVEKYIQYMADMVDINTLTVTTIVHDILTLPEANNLTDRRLIYLGPSESIPVPKIFVKIIHYKLPIPNQDDENFFHFYVAIVIHNQLDTPLEDKLCQDVCPIGTITKNLQNKNMLYCCAINDLQIEGIETPLQPYGLLDLNYIPKRLNNQAQIIETVYIPPFY